MSKTEDAVPPLPTTVRIAGGLVAFEGAVGLGCAVALIVRALTGHHERAINSYGTAAWFAILAGAVVAAGLALAKARRWGRGIGVLTQLLLLPVAWSLLTDSHRPVIGTVLGIVAVVTLGMLFAPPTNRWMIAK